MSCLEIQGARKAGINSSKPKRDRIFQVEPSVSHFWVFLYSGGKNNIPHKIRRITSPIDRLTWNIAKAPTNSSEDKTHPIKVKTLDIQSIFIGIFKLIYHHKWLLLSL
jgi:hypothetical protein